VTLNRLYRELGKLIDKGHGRKTVVIDKRTFTHPLEDDGCCMIDVEGVEPAFFNRLDDDGYTALNKDGSERTMSAVVLTGGSDPRA
jgi:hypothetical protein